MKMKLLDYTLICLLAGGAPLAAAQEPSPSDAGPAPRDGAEIDCAEGVCRSGRGVLVRVRSRGEDAPRTPADAATAQALQPDRRVEVAAERPGKAVAIATRSLQLPGGGVIWATEDPALGQPELNASAPSFVAFDGARIAQPVRFYVYSNYPDFIGRAEILLYRASDADLVTPVATVPLQVGNTIEAEWDGALPREAMPRVGDELQYVVRAYGKDGAQYDETYPQRIQLVRPEDAERGLQRLRSQIEDKFGTAFGSTEQAQRQSLVDSAYGGNGLRQQNIPIYGSRVRIHGRDIPEGYSLRINGQSQPLDLERKLAAEYLVPIGRHPFRVELTGADQQTLERTLDVDVSGRYLFAVALADVTASKNSVGGSVEPLAPDDRFDDSFLVEGRLAFYLKGKVKGKYLITAQADTQEREVGELFNGFWDADPQDVFRRLDPDLYYPVYGDDSTTYRDVDTQGRLYVRVDWDKNQALWGNFATGFTGTEYGQYSRALYGGALAWRSQRNTVLGEPATELRGFASEAQSAPGHSEFLGTGGSLYYLKHTDLLPGSDRLVLEIRDAATGRAEKRVDLLRGADYDIDELQGRVILTRPPAQVTRENIPTLTRDAPLDGYVQVLLADYEYVPSGFDADELAAGLRGKHWFGDHVALGATYVDENRAGEDYSLRGADLTLQAGRGTYLKLEHAESDATSVPVFFSDNGGLSFTELNSGLGARSGEANSAEARVNLRELGWTGRDWSAGAW